jgi:hypothetical protein
MSPPAGPPFSLTQFDEDGTMEELLHVELTVHERDVLLKGLRHVRSSIMLQMRDPTPDDERLRSCQLDEIQNLCQRLESTDPQPARV